MIRSFLVFIFVALAACSPQPSPTETKPIQGRPTFTASVQQMIDRYNNVARKIDESLLLPAADALEDGGKNDKFHVLRHAVRKNVYVTIEVDNASGRPFSLGATGVPTNNDELQSLIAVLPTVGATILGKGEQAGMLVRECTKAMDQESNPSSIRVDEFEVFCSNAMGLWIAGISVVNKEFPKSTQ